MAWSRANHVNFLSSRVFRFLVLKTNIILLCVVWMWNEIMHMEEYWAEQLGRYEGLNKHKFLLFPPEDWVHSTDIYWAPTSPVRCSVVKGGRHFLMTGWLLAAFGLARGWGSVHGERFIGLFSGWSPTWLLLLSLPSASVQPLSIDSWLVILLYET